MFLLDTNIVSNVLKSRPSPILRAKLATVPRAQQFICSITVGELLYGAGRSSQPLALTAKIEEILLAVAAVLPFDVPAARRYADVRVFLEKQGTPLEEADQCIAAIALANGLIMVTGNTRHFRRVPGLTVENWLEE